MLVNKVDFYKWKFEVFFSQTERTRSRYREMKGWFGFMFGIKVGVFIQIPNKFLQLAK